MGERLNGNNGHRSEFNGGALIVNTSDQTKIQPVIIEYAEKAKDWEFSEQVKLLNRWAGIYKERLLDPVAVPGKSDLTDPVISFEHMRVETLAAYTLNRNNHGLFTRSTSNWYNLQQQQQFTIAQN